MSGVTEKKSPELTHLYCRIRKSLINVCSFVNSLLWVTGIYYWCAADEHANKSLQESV